jgi:hypothetical protein
MYLKININLYPEPKVPMIKSKRLRWVDHLPDGRNYKRMQNTRMRPTNLWHHRHWGKDINRYLGETWCEVVEWVYLPQAGTYGVLLWTQKESQLHYICQFFCFVNCASRYMRVITPTSVYSVTIPLHVSGLLVAHHQEVTIYIYDMTWHDMIW